MLIDQGHVGEAVVRIRCGIVASRLASASGEDEEHRESDYSECSAGKKNGAIVIYRHVRQNAGSHLEECST